MKNLDFDNFFTTQLNEAQQQAVCHPEGPLLVISGAGSGKTRVITARIVHLILEQQVAANSIIALTFTNKAAQEMKERVHQFGVGGRFGFIGTFHAYCLQLLKRYQDFLPYPNFTILDSDDQEHLLATLIKKAGLEKRISAKNLGYQISSYKNNCNNTKSDFFIDPMIQQLHSLYEQEKKLSHCFDFDDLLLEILALFKREPSIKQLHQKFVRHILIDEYQDTNVTQHELLKQMSLDEGKFAIDSLCAVGDEDQSIYSWRGATVENMVYFQEDFANTKVVKIEQNYRSVQPILDTANAIIANNVQRHPKKLWSDKKASDRIRILQCLSGYQEGEAIAQAIKKLKTTPNCKTVAVLYRAHYQSRALEELLIRHSISYTIIGGITFYERKEIKDMLAYLRLTINPFDRVSLARAINCPMRGLGEKFQEDLFALWEQQPFYSFIDCCTAMIEQDLVTGIKRKSLENFVALFKTIAHESSTALATLEKIISQTSYFDYLSSSFDKEEASEKTDNVKELLRALKHFDQLGITKTDQFLHEVALMQEKKALAQETDYTVTLMTFHAAKGLEFDMVILTGLEEGVFPSARSINEPQGLEEERRLLYVGVTRAREYLLLTHTRCRYTFKTMTDQQPSRFLQEFPQNLATAAQSNNWHDLQFAQFFTQWFGNKAPNAVYTFGKQPEKTLATYQATQPYSSWKKNQSVKHERFGVGIITAIETRDANTTFLTITFRSGSKKIQSSFVAPL